jgi:stage IV sporulation protein FB
LIQNLRGMKLKLHPLFLLLLVTGFAFHLENEMVIVFAIIVIHELGHICVAAAYGYRVREMELLPFGGVARLESSEYGWSPRHETIIALAGPMNNLILIGIGILLHSTGVLNDEVTDFFNRTNLMIACFNMLPALPLDGGRIFRAANAGTMGFQRATEVAIRMAFLMSSLCMLLGIVALALGYMHVGILVLSVFLFVSAWQLKRQVRYEAIRFLDSRRRVKADRPRQVRALAVSEMTALQEVVADFAPDSYHVVYVLDGAHDVKGVLAERELIETVFEQENWRKPIGQFLDVID